MAAGYTGLCRILRISYSHISATRKKERKKRKTTQATARLHVESIRKKEKKTTQAARRSASIKKKETHWPKAPRVSFINGKISMSSSGEN